VEKIEGDFFPTLPITLMMSLLEKKLLNFVNIYFELVSEEIY
jgi:hypothetical protein